MPADARDVELAMSLSLLEATLQSTADGILVVDRTGAIVGRNRTFSRMWGLPEDDDTLSDDALIGRVLDQLAGPQAFLDRIRELYATPEASSYDEIDFLDGRVFERYSQPQLVGGEVVGRVWSFRDVTRERQLRRDLQRQAFHDSLTGLANRAQFLTRLDEAVRVTDRPLTVCVLDLDGFKFVNDVHGHRAGDQLLCDVAALLDEVVGERGLVARLGGDEFGVLLPGVDEAEVETLCRAVHRALAPVLQVGDQRVSTSSSIGYALRPAGAPTPADRLLHEADLAMYRAKGSGHGLTRRFSDDITRSDPRGAWAEVSELLADPDALAMVYQPICDLATGRVVGYEALCRFPGREHRRVDQWFALARSSGDGPALEARAVRLALASAERPEGTYLTVNVSPATLVTEEVRDAFDRDLTGVVVEITEDSRIETPDLERMTRFLRERGAGLAMDDTGAGYDGLKRLVRVRPEVVKLDRELVSELHVRPEKSALVEALVSFCRRTGAALCAEGVEQPEEYVALADLGVALGQGWLIGRPAPAFQGVSEQALLARAAAARRPGDLGPAALRLAAASVLADVGRALDPAKAALQVDDIAFSSVEGDLLRVVTHHRFVAAGELYDLADYPLTTSCMTTGVPVGVRVDDPEADPHEVRCLRDLGFMSLLLVPVLDADGVAVALLELYDRGLRTWSATDVRRSMDLAAAVADALLRVGVDGAGVSATGGRAVPA